MSSSGQQPPQQQQLGTGGEGRPRRGVLYTTPSPARATPRSSGRSSTRLGRQKAAAVSAADVQRLEERLREKEAELQASKIQHKIVIDKNSLLNDSLKSLQERVRRHKDAAAQATTEAQRAQGLVRAKDAALNAAREELERTRQSEKALEHTVRDQGEEIERLREELDVRVPAAKEVVSRHEYATVLEANEALKCDLAAARREAETKTDQLQRVTQHRNDLQTQCQQLRSSLMDVRKEKDEKRLEAERNLAAAQRRVRALEQDVEALQDEQAELSAAAAEAKSGAEQQRIINRLQRDLKKRERQIGQERQRRAEAEAEAERQQRRGPPPPSPSTRDLQQKQALLDSTGSNASTATTAAAAEFLRARASEAEERYVDSQRQIAALVSRNNDASARTVELENKLTAARDQYARTEGQLQGMLESVNAEAERLRTYNDQFVASNKELEARLRAAKERLDASRQEVSSLKLRLSQANHALQEANERAGRHEQTSAEWQRQHQLQTTRLDDAVRYTGELERRHVNLLKHMSKLARGRRQRELLWAIGEAPGRPSFLPRTGDVDMLWNHKIIESSGTATPRSGVAGDVDEDDLDASAIEAEDDTENQGDLTNSGTSAGANARRRRLQREREQQARLLDEIGALRTAVDELKAGQRTVDVDELKDLLQETHDLLESIRDGDQDSGYDGNGGHLHPSRDTRRSSVGRSHHSRHPSVQPQPLTYVDTMHTQVSLTNTQRSIEPIPQRVQQHESSGSRPDYEKWEAEIQSVQQQQQQDEEAEQSSSSSDAPPPEIKEDIEEDEEATSDDDDYSGDGDDQEQEDEEDDDDDEEEAMQEGGDGHMQVLVEDTDTKQKEEERKKRRRRRRGSRKKKKKKTEEEEEEEKTADSAEKEEDEEEEKLKVSTPRASSSTAGSPGQTSPPPQRRARPNLSGIAQQLAELDENVRRIQEQVAGVHDDVRSGNATTAAVQAATEDMKSANEVFQDTSLSNDERILDVLSHVQGLASRALEAASGARENARPEAVEELKDFINDTFSQLSAMHPSPEMAAAAAAAAHGEDLEPLLQQVRDMQARMSSMVEGGMFHTPESKERHTHSESRTIVERGDGPCSNLWMLSVYTLAVSLMFTLIAVTWPEREPDYYTT